MQLGIVPAALVAIGMLASGAAAQSGVLSGQVRDSLGNPVPSALLQFESNDPDVLPFVSGGFTAADGSFNATVTPQGSYRLTIYPLAAPQSLVVTDRFENVVVGATPTNMGTLVLELGVLVTGRVVNTAGTGLVEVDLSFVGPGNEALDFTNKHTNSQGYFAVAMPHGPSEMHFEPGAPPYYGGVSTAPLRLYTNFQANTELGDVVLPLGWGVSGQVVRQDDGTPVEDARISFVDSVTGASAFVPKDKTDEFGAFAATLPAATYDLRILAREEELAPTEALGIAVPPGGLLGTLALGASLELTGTVRGADNNRIGGVTLRLLDPVTHRARFTGDPVLSKGNGSYSVFVGAGTYDLEFSPPFTVPYGLSSQSGVVLAGDTARNASLPALPFFATSGTGVAGLGGITPTISATGGTPRVGNLGYTLNCTQGRGAAFSAVLVAIVPPNSPIKVRTPLGDFGVAPRIEILRLGGAPGTAGTGTGQVALPIPRDAGMLGQTILSRFLVLDSAAVGGRASTTELTATIAP